MENLTYTENTKQGFPLSPPPLNTRKTKAPENCNLSFIDQIQDGDYSGSKLVRTSPRTNRDTYFVLRTRATSIRSYRRNYSHKSVALYRTKKEGSTRKNIEYMTSSFVELDGANDNTVKSLEDVLALISNNNLPTESYVSQTSRGNFHVIWTYNNPLPWTTKNESYWISQQKRLIELFQKAGFNVDKGASLNPCQNLRNPSQLQPYNFKRKCQVFIYNSYQKTSLRRLYKALNGTNIPNPKPMPASVKLRRHNRANRTFITTNAELAETLGTCTKTAQREVSKAIANGDLQIVRRIGNNHGTKRATEYLSTLYIEPQFPERTLSIFKDNSLKTAVLLADFQASGAKKGRRQKTLFALGLFLKARLGKRASVESIRDALEGGAMRSRVSVREFEKTLRNVMKSIYKFPLSLAKMRSWELIEEPKHFH